MKRDTKRIEALLEGTKKNRQLVREELADGSSLQHVYDDLGNHEQTFGARLRDLKDWNAREEKAAEAKAKAAAEAKAPEAPTTQPLNSTAPEVAKKTGKK